MPDNFSTHLHFYSLLALFALLFVLQIWAMLKIKSMLRHVVEIYQRMQRLAASNSASTPALELQPSEKNSVNVKSICEYCRYRETFLDPSGKGVFIFRCGLSKKRINMDDSCSHFEFDSLRAQI